MFMTPMEKEIYRGNGLDYGVMLWGMGIWGAESCNEAV